MTDPRHLLCCQACGRIVRVLTEAEAQMVAERPYDFIYYCLNRECQEMAIADARREGLG